MQMGSEIADATAEGMVRPGDDEKEGPPKRPLLRTGDGRRDYGMFNR